MWTISVRAILNLFVRLPPGSGVSLPTSGSSSIAAARNDLVREFLRERSWQWMLFVDSDMEPPPDALARLVAHDKDIASAFYFGRQPPHAIMAYPVRPMFLEEFVGLQEMQWVGFGCVLLRRRVLETIPDPWFEHPEAPGKHEDQVFCTKARDAGFRVWLDCDLEAGHVTPVSLGRNYIDAFDRAREGHAGVERQQWWPPPVQDASTRRVSRAHDANGVRQSE
jgi:GT2 family glycosyltransferase